MIVAPQGCVDGGMRADDATESELQSYDEKTSEERVFSTESWYNQGAEEGKAAGEGGLERRDDYADFTNEVRLSLRWAGLY